MTIPRTPNVQTKPTNDPKLASTKGMTFLFIERDEVQAVHRGGFVSDGARCSFNESLGRSKLTSRAKSSQRFVRDSSVFSGDSNSSKVIRMVESGR
jgi:hypothetical protein